MCERNLFLQEVQSKGWNVILNSDDCIKVEIQNPTIGDVDEVCQYVSMYSDNGHLICEEIMKGFQRQEGVRTLIFVMAFQ